MTAEALPNGCPEGVYLPLCEHGREAITSSGGGTAAHADQARQRERLDAGEWVRLGAWDVRLA